MKCKSKGFGIFCCLLPKDFRAHQGILNKLFDTVLFVNAPFISVIFSVSRNTKLNNKNHKLKSEVRFWIWHLEYTILNDKAFIGSRKNSEYSSQVRSKRNVSPNMPLNSFPGIRLGYFLNVKTLTETEYCANLAYDYYFCVQRKKNHAYFITRIGLSCGLYLEFPRWMASINYMKLNYLIIGYIHWWNWLKCPDPIRIRIDSNPTFYRISTSWAFYSCNLTVFKW